MWYLTFPLCRGKTPLISTCWLTLVIVYKVAITCSRLSLGMTPGEDSVYEWGGDARRKFWIKAPKGDRSGSGPSFFWPLKETMLKHRQYIYIYIYFFSRATLNETFTAKYDGVLSPPLSYAKYPPGGLAFRYFSFLLVRFHNSTERLSSCRNSFTLIKHFI